MGDQTEGLAWLGRAPSPHAGRMVRSTLRAFRWIMGTVADVQVTVEGREHLPAGGYIVACAAHRSWFDGPVLMSELTSPRIWYIASASAIFKFPGMEWSMRRFGGMVPVHRGGIDIDVHVEAAQAILDSGAVFGIYPEGTRTGDELGLTPFRRGVGLIGLRTGAAIVPVALGGTKTLYRGRRVGLRFLPPTTALILAGLDVAPTAGTAAELDAARLVSDALAAVLTPAVADLTSRAQDPAGHPRRWRWMSDLFT